MAKSILVVDDEKEMTEMLKMRLEASGYEVDTAHDGQAEDKKLGQEVGSDAYITKPFEPQTLMGTIQTILKD